MPLEKFASQWGLSELQLVYNIRNAKSRKGDEARVEKVTKIYE
ncbi:MAG: hypothetical protein RIR08_362 [Pseudomonadota bacterium]